MQPRNEKGNPDTRRRAAGRPPFQRVHEPDRLALSGSFPGHVGGRGFVPAIPVNHFQTIRDERFRRLFASATVAAKKILDRPAVRPSAFYAAATLGFARAANLAGEIPKARKAYQDFFGLWKDADPDIPILTQAKTEYANLQ